MGSVDDTVVVVVVVVAVVVGAVIGEPGPTDTDNVSIAGTTADASRPVPMSSEVVSPEPASADPVASAWAMRPTPARVAVTLSPVAATFEASAVRGRRWVISRRPGAR